MGGEAREPCRPPREVRNAAWLRVHARMPARAGVGVRRATANRCRRSRSGGDRDVRRGERGRGPAHALDDRRSHRQGRRAGDQRRSAGRHRGPRTVAALRRRLRQPPPLAHRRHHAGERGGSEGGVGVPERDGPAVRGVADGLRRHHVRHHLLQPPVRARRRHRRTALALRPPASAGDGTPAVLRQREPRRGDQRRHRADGHLGRQAARLPSAHRRTALGEDAGGLRRGIQRHVDAHDRQGHGRHRHRRRGVRRARLLRRLRRRHRRTALAPLHGAGGGRTRRGDLGRGFVEDGRRPGVDERRLRSAARRALLDHRQPVAGLERRPARWRQPFLQQPAGRQPRHGRAPLALPVHPPRRLGLRRQHATLPGGRRARRHDHASHRAGQPQRLLLHPGARHRRLHRRRAVREGTELGDAGRKRPPGGGP